MATPLTPRQQAVLKFLRGRLKRSQQWFAATDLAKRPELFDTFDTYKVLGYGERAGTEVVIAVLRQLEKRGLVESRKPTPHRYEWRAVAKGEDVQ